MPNLKALDVQVVSLVARAAVRNAENPTEPQRFLVWKRQEGVPMPDPTPEELAASLKKAEEERDAAKKAETEAAEKLTKAETANTTLSARVAELEKAAKPEDNPAPVDLSKADPAVRALLEKAAADQAAMAERLEKAEKATEESDKLAKAERETRLTREFVAKAETFKSLPVEAAKFGPVLKSAAEKLTKEESDELDRVLKAAAAQLTEGLLFKEQGQSGQPAPAADSAIAEVQQKAEQIKKADPKMSDGQALQAAMSSDRDLQARYLAETR